MALKKSLSYSGKASLRLDDSVVQLGQQNLAGEFYVKVDNIYGNKNQMSASVVFALGDATLQKTYAFSLDLDGGNPIKQAYEHLKTLPEFEGAVDC